MRATACGVKRWRSVRSSLTSSSRPGPRPGHRLAALVTTMRRNRGSMAWFVALVAAFGLGAASGSYILGRPTATVASPTPQTIVVRAGTLSRSVRSLATADWSTVRRLYAPASGIVTEAVSSPGFLHAGDILMRINERPLVVVPGEIPAYRPLEAGLEGRDVAALQRYLGQAGFVVDAALERFTAVTAAAVRAWQRSLGLPPTGVVRLGDVLFVPPEGFEGPTRWVGEVATGATIAAGTPIIEVLSRQPVLSMELGSAAPSQLVPGLRGEALFPNGSHRPVVLAAIESTPGQVLARLAPEPEPLCRGEECLELVPLGGGTGVSVDWIIVPETSGALVPVGALQSDAAGVSFVQLSDGSRRPVAVRVVSGGMAIVTGVEVGETILLP